MYISNEYTRLQGQRDSKITALGYDKDGDGDRDTHEDADADPNAYLEVLNTLVYHLYLSTNA